MSAMGRSYAHILAWIHERCWAIDPAYLRLVDGIVHERIVHGRPSDDEIAARIAAQVGEVGQRLGARDVGAVRIIPIYGPILPRSGPIEQASGITTLEDLRSTIGEAIADRSVERIVLDVDSPGGAVDGLPEFAAWLRGQRDRKPITAVANTLMTSAAYWIAAQASEIVASPSAVVGSIGTVAIHEDHSRADEAAGWKVTLISSDPAKIWGNEYEPLSEEARADIQGRVDAFARMFVRDVAAGRRTSPQVVADQYSGGRVLLAADALAAGMVDRIASYEDTVGALVRQTSSRSRSRAEGGAIRIEAKPLPPHRTETSDGPWDAAEHERRLPSGDGAGTVLRRAYAWVDPDGDPDVKASYKFIHHEVSPDGVPGPANLRACATGRAVLAGARGGTTIPAEDRAGVWEHLAAHERDAGREVPEFQGSTTPVDLAARLAALPPLPERQAWAAQLKERTNGLRRPQHAPDGRRAARLPGQAHRSAHRDRG
jgi:signal peptide peptidase SppA